MLTQPTGALTSAADLRSGAISQFGGDRIDFSDSYLRPEDFYTKRQRRRRARGREGAGLSKQRLWQAASDVLGAGMARIGG